jgi:ethanolaminephosphotransferase
MYLFMRAKMMHFFSNVGIVLGVVVFMAGYFSPPPRLAFENDLEQAGLQGAGEEERYSQQSAPFDKVVFMVIDALRRCDTSIIRSSQPWELRPANIYIPSDFVYGEDSGFSFTQR